jgi:hypothetical protein
MYYINRVFECYVGKFVQKRSASMSKGGLPHECTSSSVRIDGHDYFVIYSDRSSGDRSSDEQLNNDFFLVCRKNLR